MLLILRAPTYTVDLSKLILQIIQTDKFGIYHATNEGYCSWYDFSKIIFQYTDKQVLVHPIFSESYYSDAKRPNNSRLSKISLDEHGFHRLPHWKDALIRYINQLLLT